MTLPGVTGRFQLSPSPQLSFINSSNFLHSFFYSFTKWINNKFNLMDHNKFGNWLCLSRQENILNMALYNISVSHCLNFLNWHWKENMIPLLNLDVFNNLNLVFTTTNKSTSPYQQNTFIFLKRPITGNKCKNKTTKIHERLDLFV